MGFTLLIVSDAPGLEDVIVVLSPGANQQLTTDELLQLIAGEVGVQTLHDNLGVVTDDGIKPIQIVLVLFRQPTAEIETALGGDVIDMGNEEHKDGIVVH